MNALGTENKPLRVAIIGAGPSGMYAADSLFKSSIKVTVDAFDRLPTPYGLLRGGVAPDHQRMKSVSKYYDRVAANDSFNFYGNVEIGKDISIDELKTYYDALIFTFGAESDKRLGIDGEDLSGSYAATEFVGWYNGHPDYQTHQFDLSQKVAVVIGQGNVAIDVTRILSKSISELKDSDITEKALDKLKHSKITDIHLIGRRGPVQAAFTQLEIKELGELEECDVIVDPKDLILSESDQQELADNKKAQKNYEILKEFSVKPLGNKKKRIHIHFFKSPLLISGTVFVSSMELGINVLSGSAGHQKAVLSDKRETLACGLIFRSVGYKGVGIKGLPFDEKSGVIPNIKGRIISNDSVLKGFYTSGWIKRGPSGVLGSNKPDSAETVECILEDINSLLECNNRDTKVLIEKLNKQTRVITFEDWNKIDNAEVLRGEALGKPREKFTNLQEMLNVLESK